MRYYDEKRKERYIKERHTDSTFGSAYLPRLFRNSKAFEVEYEKDVCDFTTPEIVNMLKTFSYTSISTLVGDVSQYAIYTGWCLENGFVKDGQNHFREINRQNADQYVNKVLRNQNVFSPKELRHLETLINNASDMVLLWLAFEGLTLEEIGQLRPEDVIVITEEGNKPLGQAVNLASDIKGSEITTCNGRHFVVDSHISELMFESSQETEYRATDDSRAVRLIDDGHIIKGSTHAGLNSTPSQISRRLRMRIYRIAQDTGANLNPTNLRNSGLIWYIRQGSKEKEIDVKTFINSPEGRELLKRYGKGSVATSTILLQFGEFLK